MRYISTRGGIKPVSFGDAVLMGMARDGGLLLPEEIPDVSAELGRWRGLSYTDLAVEIFGLFADLPPNVLRSIVERSYETFDSAEITPVARVGDLSLLELFHGPTLAFKDVALQFLGNVFEYLLDQRDEEMNVLAATSGDTGSAAIYGVRGKERIRIFVMYPHGRISGTQELQMTSVLDQNVYNLAVKGTFDDCQGIMKALFNDLEFKDKYKLGSVNSINWARLLAQIVYYFYGAFRVMESGRAEKVRFAVPTGNFGDILAGYIASRMGLPVALLVLATNENDILSRFFNTGLYRVGTVHATVSPSMDIQVASNFERYLYYRLGEDPERLTLLMESFKKDGDLSVNPGPEGAIDDLFAADAATTEDTLATIKDVYDQHGRAVDPHTAVGISVARRFMRQGEPMICLATAHAAKFPEAITRALGKNVTHHHVLDALHGMSSRRDVLGADAEDVKRYISERVDR